MAKLVLVLLTCFICSAVLVQAASLVDSDSRSEIPQEITLVKFDWTPPPIEESGKLKAGRPDKDKANDKLGTLKICATEDLLIKEDEIVDFLFSIDEEEVNKEGKVDDVDTNCATFELAAYPFVTTVQAYDLIIKPKQGLLKVGKAKFAVDVKATKVTCDTSVLIRHNGVPEAGRDNCVNKEEEPKICYLPAGETGKFCSSVPNSAVGVGEDSTIDVCQEKFTPGDDLTVESGDVLTITSLSYADKSLTYVPQVVVEETFETVVSVGNKPANKAYVSTVNVGTLTMEDFEQGTETYTVCEVRVSTENQQATSMNTGTIKDLNVILVDAAGILEFGMINANDDPAKMYVAAATDEAVTPADSKAVTANRVTINCEGVKDPTHYCYGFIDVTDIVTSGKGLLSVAYDDEGTNTIVAPFNAPEDAP